MFTINELFSFCNWHTSIWFSFLGFLKLRVPLPATLAVWKNILKSCCSLFPCVLVWLTYSFLSLHRLDCTKTCVLFLVNYKAPSFFLERARGTDGGLAYLVYLKTRPACLCTNFLPTTTEKTFMIEFVLS